MPVAGAYTDARATTAAWVALICAARIVDVQRRSAPDVVGATRKARNR
jgi:hypothetical protein